MKIHDIIDYQEEPTSSFYSNGKDYNLNKLFKIASKKKIYKIPVEKLKWILSTSAEVDNDRVDQADLSAPILFTTIFDKESNQELYLVIDGFHRLTKAVNNNIEYIPGKFITSEELETALIN